MATYALTVSTDALGLSVIDGAIVVAERKRTTVNDIYPTSSLYTKKTATNVSGIATIQLEADDGTVFHEIKIFDASGVLVYKNTIQMPPQAADIEDLPLNDIITESATQAVAASVTATTQANTATAQAGIATTQAGIATEQAVLTAADRVQTGLDVIAAEAAADAAAADAASIIVATKKFSTYAEQMAYVGAYVDGQKADVLGYYAIGDGGFIQMYWSASSTADHNGGTVRQPTAVSGAGRWLAVDISYINAKQFGADGVANDTTAISSAIDEANTHGLPVTLESGKTYLCDALSKSRVHLVCLGSATIKADSGIATGSSVITSADILLDGVSVDGDSIVTRAVTATGKYMQRRSSISNVLGTAVSFGRLVYATSTCTEFDVDDSCYFSGVSGVENGTEGDTSGADCGLYIEASMFSIVGATFTNIGGYEDGDCIRVQLSADAELLWASAAGSKIAHCKFDEIRKRAIKCQASDVLIYGNVVTSTVVTDPSCPYAAIDIYGSQNTVSANSIDLARAVSGIIDNGKNNIIEGNSVKVAATTAYTTARTSATSAIRNQSSVGSRVSKNAVISKTVSSFYVYQSEGSIHANNRVSGDAATNQVGIYVDGGSGNLQIGNDISGTSGSKLRYGVQADNSIYNRVFSNIFQQMTAGIRYNGTTQASRNGGNVFGAGVSNVIDYTGAGASTAQTIGDHDGSVVTNVSPGSIAAHSTYSIDVSWPPFVIGGVYVVNPASSGTILESGLMISIEPKSAGVATFKMHNITASPITPAARNYKIRSPM